MAPPDDQLGTSIPADLLMSLNVPLPLFRYKTLGPRLQRKTSWSPSLSRSPTMGPWQNPRNPSPEASVTSLNLPLPRFLNRRLGPFSAVPRGSRVHEAK